MWYIVISLIGLGVVAAIAGYFRNKKLQKMLERGEISEIPEAQEIPEVCCGQHETARKSNIITMRNWIGSKEWKRTLTMRKPLRSFVKCFIPSGKWRWPVGSVACNCEGSICQMP